MTRETDHLYGKGLHAKLAEVMAEAERIPKNGKAPAAMGGYPFVQVGDAADFIRKALGQRGVSMLPTTLEIIGQNDHETRSGGTMTTVELRITWTVTDGETQQSATFQSYGVGADTGDKYSGKATTTAMKYALLSGFLLSTGDDVETADTSDRRIRAEELPAADTGPDGLIGTVIRQGTQDFELRQGPDGARLPFRLKNGSSSFICVAEGQFAESLAFEEQSAHDVIGQRVTVWGHWTDEEFPKGKQTVRFRVLHVERMKHAEWTLPGPSEPVAPGQVEAFDMAESAAIDAAEAEAQP